jgi:hypothetical protein
LLGTKEIPEYCGAEKKENLIWLQGSGPEKMDKTQ